MHVFEGKNWIFIFWIPYYLVLPRAAKGEWDRHELRRLGQFLAPGVGFLAIGHVLGLWKTIMCRTTMPVASGDWLTTFNAEFWLKKTVNDWLANPRLRWLSQVEKPEGLSMNFSPFILYIGEKIKSSLFSNRKYITNLFLFSFIFLQWNFLWLRLKLHDEAVFARHVSVLYLLWMCELSFFNVRDNGRRTRCALGQVQTSQTARLPFSGFLTTFSGGTCRLKLKVDLLTFLTFRQKIIPSVLLFIHSRPFLEVHGKQGSFSRNFLPISNSVTASGRTYV